MFSGTCRRTFASRFVVAAPLTARGFVPVLVDGTEIEVGGELFEGAGRSYNAERALLLHGVFVGGPWASGRLHLGRFTRRTAGLRRRTLAP